MKRLVALKITEKLMINHRLPEAMEAAEEVMKLWDQGFTYEVKRDTRQVIDDGYYP